MSYTIKLLPSGHAFQAKPSQTIVEAAIETTAVIAVGINAPRNIARSLFMHPPFHVLN